MLVKLLPEYEGLYISDISIITKQKPLNFISILHHKFLEPLLGKFS